MATGEGSTKKGNYPPIALAEEVKRRVREREKVSSYSIKASVLLRNCYADDRESWNIVIPSLITSFDALTAVLYIYIYM